MTHQMGAGLQQALTQVTGQVQLQSQTTQSVAAKLDVVEREISMRTKVSSPIIPNIEVNVHNGKSTIPSTSAVNDCEGQQTRAKHTMEEGNVWENFTLDPLECGPIYGPKPMYIPVSPRKSARASGKNSNGNLDGAHSKSSCDGGGHTSEASGNCVQ